MAVIRQDWKLSVVGALVAVSALLISPAAIHAQESAAKAPAAPAQVKTPRTADGHPDLTALWSSGPPFNGLFATEVSADGKKRGVYVRSNTEDLDLNRENRAKKALEAREKDPNKPPYKPELLSKIKELADHYDHTDPTFRCAPPGVPRMGPPNQIAQTPGQVIFLYATNVGEFFRVIPTDGRKHQTDIDPSYVGDSVGHWEGDTLVVDAIGFNDETWLQAERGYIHSEALHVIERFTRDGNTLHYEVTVEDPNVFTRPWTMKPAVRHLGAPDETLPQVDPCIDRDEPHMPKDFSAPMS